MRGRPVYQPENDRIIIFSCVDFTGNITIASAKDGKIIDSKEINMAPCAYLSVDKAVLCCTGKMYDVSGDHIQEIKEPFAFVVGK